MNTLEELKKPSKSEQKVATTSYTALLSVIQQISSGKAEIEIEIEETKEKIVLPTRALKLLGDILKSMSQGNPISIVPIATEVTTQKAAEILGCSRPHLVKLLEDGKIAFTKVGKHRRINFSDIIKFRKQMKDAQKKHIIDIMNFDEEIGLYDS
jgi:excisionase family DNA binding protein